MTVRLQRGDLLLVIDVQVDFVTGALAVPDAQAIISVINRLIREFKHRGLPVVATRDWHPLGHVSFRERGGDGRFVGDALTLEGHEGAGEPLLVPFMRGGEPIEPRVTFGVSRAGARRQLLRLPEPLRSLAPATAYPVEVSAAIRALAAEADARA